MTPKISVKIKICGLTQGDQALECVEIGANMIGLNCWNGSPRYISPDKLSRISNELRGSVETAAVFVNEQAEFVNNLVLETKIDVAQLHGDESSEYTQKLYVPWFKAFRVKKHFQADVINNYDSNRFLLDNYSKEYGGTGKTFDWELAKQTVNYGEMILAGGLTVDNVADAILRVRPYAVDVSSGVEKKPGIKDMQKVKEFIMSVRNTEAELNYNTI